MNFARQKDALVERRGELNAHLSAVEHALDEAPPKDWEDRASERQGDEVLEMLGLKEMAELRRIDAALARIEAGTYGTCQRCGESIAEARLEFLPDTPCCTACAS
ncbi:MULTISPECIES: TraR/DksA family transcriptional regulator [unclassified Roseovarius]|uniref:TraR/DksA family transcriptional regulator n=1 Tax=unclassified Roseovarius TaxID=2614913 RepID=UPI00273F5DD4|nr:TraR/DksA family transcriptional regulator [Roseovarius sp. MMSF_3350]